MRRSRLTRGRACLRTRVGGGTAAIWGGYAAAVPPPFDGATAAPIGPRHARPFLGRRALGETS